MVICLRKKKKILIGSIMFTILCFLFAKESYIAETEFRAMRSFELQEKPYEVVDIQNDMKDVDSIRLSTIKAVTEFYFNSNQNNQSKLIALLELQRLTFEAFDKIQNPQNCSSAKKLICDLGQLGNGLGSKFHQVVHCHFIAFSLQRVLYLQNFRLDHGEGSLEFFLENFNRRCKAFKPDPYAATITSAHLWLNSKRIDNIPMDLVYRHNLKWIRGPYPSSLPGCIPKSMAKILNEIHYEPSLWYVGQSMSYLFGKPLPHYTVRINKLRKENELLTPYIGMHVRHGDKIIKEAKYIKATKYLEKVKQYINNIPLIKHNNSSLKPIYLATDDPMVLSELSKINNNSDNYHIVSFHDSTNNALRLKHGGAYQYQQMRDTLDDLFLLSNAYAVICTFTSNLGRLIYELRQTITPEYFHTQYNTISMDSDWYFGTSGYEHYPDKMQGYAHKDCNHGNGVTITTCFSGQWFIVDKKEYIRAKSTPERLLHVNSNNKVETVSMDDIIWVNGESEELDKVFNQIGLL